MPVELRNIPGVPEPTGYTHLSIATGQRLIHISGQVGTDEQGNVVEGGLRAQAERALLNVGRALDAAGATEADLAKLTVYVAGWAPSMYADLGAGLMAAREARPGPAVPVTLIGVQSLFTPELLVEIEGMAISAG